jgi:DNA invertase Pin-like site-specific DNA recombinase
VGYVRVSTQEQASSGLGLAAQRAAVTALAARRSIDLGTIHADEGISGAEPAERRPGLTAALDDLEEGDALLVAQPDRLGRDVPEGIRLLGELKARGVVLLCANGVSTEGDDDVSWLTMMLLLVLAEFQLRQGRTRTRSALAAKKARGERLGSTPFGYELDAEGELAPDLEQLRALGIMQRMRAEGETLRAICDRLDAEGLKPKRGARWHPQSVKTVLETADRRKA